MDKAHEVLVGVAEAHATADAALEERGRAGEVEGDHALVLVPDVHHAVELVVGCLHLIDVKQLVPVVAEFGKGLIDLLGGIELGNEGVSLVLVDDLRDLDSFGLFFEDFAVRDLSVYAGSMRMELLFNAP